MKIAFVIVERRIWTGGYNYVLNLVRALARYEPMLRPVVFFGTDSANADRVPFEAIAGAEVVISPMLDLSRRVRTQVKAIILGSDRSLRDLFAAHRIDVLFEAAQFFGTRIARPSIAWMADFQHRLLPHLFPAPAYWKRELGFRLQIWANRTVMVSSEDAQSNCEELYPSTRGRVHVVRFAVPARPRATDQERRSALDTYALPADFFFLPNQFWRHKNHECVIRALHVLKSRGREDIVVAASGNPLDPRDPEHFSRLRELAGRLGVEAQFRFLGMIPDSHLYVLLGECTALLNPSTFEGWSTTVEEAKSAGTPMVLSNLRVHREQAEDSALYFDPASPEDLAQVLGRYVPLDRARRNQRIADAFEASEGRVQSFAADFGRLIESIA